MNMAKENVNINMLQKAMISQPMKGMSRDDILAARECAIAFLTERGYDVEDTFFTDDGFISDDTKNVSIAYLAKSIEAMSKCDAVYFCKGWANARGCKIEHKIAEEYGLIIIDES